MNAGDLNPMDRRHRDWLRHILLNGKYGRVMEIGLWKGNCTSAFLDALTLGTVEEVVLCDPKPTAEVKEMVYSHPLKEKITLYHLKSTEVLAKDTAFDLICVDGDHCEANVKAELKYLLPANVPIIVAHDTSSYGRYPQCDGPMHLKHEYQRAGYHCLEASLYYPNERCERGLFVGCRTPELYQIALDGYRIHC